MITLEELLAKIDDLPTMPAIALRLLELTRDPDVDMVAVASMIGKDPGITATLLKLCNSSFYGFPHKVSSIQQAAAIFGLKKISQMAITALSARYLSGATAGYSLENGDLWKHSIVTATLADRLSTKVSYADTGMAFTAGLLHDVGKIIIHQYVGDKLPEIRAAAEEQDVDFMNAEEKVLGFSHATAGALLMERWNFPAPLCDAVCHHHAPGAATADAALVGIVHIADAISMSMGMGIGSDGMHYKLSEKALSDLGFTSSTAIEEIIAVVAGKLLESPEALTPPKVA